ncbi:hypothetical protein [Kamptonema formosum]|uniref:hypothetical protein n=1 Tax=Kamptonema formosum TaxID=331992 RepID=UPI00034AE81F|nr:hypothetical protein [Oscillatoria sp. PCC 10802]
MTGDKPVFQIKESLYKKLVDWQQEMEERDKLERCAGAPIQESAGGGSSTGSDSSPHAGTKESGE